ncbi:hypothetical protein M0R04_11050 [Candidatus Dojkabacteria bacterium]|jgi:hypothetical protein|nr:hypothetical protein [Candidatus Dojkabacteria bacterium]
MSYNSTSAPRQYRSGKAFNITEALDRIYLIKLNGAKANNAYINIPKCLIGKRVKLVIVDDKKKRDKKAE